MRDDDRQRIRMLRTDVDEVNVQPIDIGDKLRQGVQPPFELAPVVSRGPVAREFLHRRELHAFVACLWERSQRGRQRPVALQAFQELSQAAPWRIIPSWALVSLPDNAIGTANERFVSTRAGARTVEVKASHAVMFVGARLGY